MKNDQNLLSITSKTSKCTLDHHKFEELNTPFPNKQLINKNINANESTTKNVHNFKTKKNL